MKLRTGRNGSAFLGCTAYPVCRNTVPVKVAGGKAEAKPDVPTGEKCPNCGHALVTRHGRFGDYVSCSNYPACRFKPPKPVTLTGVKCPVCKTGDILVRRGRFGPFYGCSNYPSCEKNFRARPVPKACPNCKAPYLLVRDRKAGAFYVCETEGCGLDVPASDLDAFDAHDAHPRGRARGRDRRGARPGAGQGREEAGGEAEGGKPRRRMVLRRVPHVHRRSPPVLAERKSDRPVPEREVEARRRERDEPRRVPTLERGRQEVRLLRDRQPLPVRHRVDALEARELLRGRASRPSRIPACPTARRGRSPWRPARSRRGARGRGCRGRRA